jgi:hypothetical protein
MKTNILLLLPVTLIMQACTSRQAPRPAPAASGITMKTFNSSGQHMETYGITRDGVTKLP